MTEAHEDGENFGIIALQDTEPVSFFIGCWREGRCPSVCSGGHALGAVFNQLVRSRAQLLLLEPSSCFFQVNKPKNPVIEIPTVKWKEGGLLVRQGLPAVYHRVISRPLGIRERLLPTRVLMSLDQPMSTFHFSLPRAL